MVSKFYAIKDGKSVKTATVVSTGFALIIGCGAYFIGSLARLILTAADNVPMTAAGGVDFDAIIPTMLVTALGDVNLFTTIILAVILLLLLSASMSTLASVVLTSASAISVDLIPVVKKDYHPKHQMGLTRGLCLLFVVLSFLFATMNISIIVNIMSFSWGVVSGCFIGPYIWGVYSKRITKAGAWSGMICGLLAVGIPTAVISIIDGFPAAAALAPEMGVFAMALSIIVTPVVSIFTKQFDKKHLETVFKA